MKRLLGVLLLASALAVAAAAGYAIRERRALAERALLEVAAGMGLGDVRLDVTEVGWRSAALRDVTVGEPADLEIARVDVSWEPRALLRLEVARLTVTGVRLQATLGADGEVSFGSLDPALEDTGESEGGVVYREVVVADATVAVETPAGPLTLEGVTARLEPDPLRIATGGFRIAAVRDQAAPGRFPPLAVDAEATPDGEEGLAVTFSASAQEGRVRVTGEGSVVPASGSGELRIALAPLQLGADATSLAALAPAFGAALPDAKGEVAGRVHVRIGAEGPLAVSGTLELRNVGLTRDGTRLRGLGGSLAFEGPAPWRTARTQELRFALLDVVGPLRDGLVRFDASGSEIRLESFEGTWAGGRIATSGRFDVVNSSGGLTVQIDDLDLEAVLEELAIADLVGTGRVSGAMPIVIDGESLRMSAAIAADPAGGVIRWRPAAGAAARLGITGDLAVVADALEDYHYEELLVGLEGDLAGEVRMRLNLKGRNPTYERGRPVHLNLEVETNAPATLLASRAATRIPEALERRLRSRAAAR